MDIDQMIEMQKTKLTNEIESFLNSFEKSTTSP